MVLKAFNRSLGAILPPRLLSRSIPGIPGRVHVDDLMLTSEAPRHLRHYVEDAQSGMQNIEESLAAVGRRWDDVAACLDFASGYGRLTRFLAARLTPRRVTVADVDRAAVRFCRAEFGVAGFLSATDPYRITIPGTYDLIFVGSLLTHLPRDECWPSSMFCSPFSARAASSSSAPRAKAASSISIGTARVSLPPNRSFALVSLGRVPTFCPTGAVLDTASPSTPPTS